MKKSVLLLFSISICCVLQIHGQIAYDSSSSFSADGLASGTFSHTTAGVNRILIVGVGSKGGSVSSMTYAGVNMSLLAAVTQGGEVRTELWYLVNPATGTNSIIVNMDAPRKFVCGSNSFTCVNQITPFSSSATATGNSTTPSVTVVSATGELVVDALCVKESNPAVGALQTQRTELVTVENYWHSTSEENGAASVVMSYSTTAKPWAIVAGSLMPDCIPLPVELISFNVVPMGSDAQCSWVTKSEINSDFFILEKSGDGLEWSTVATVNAAGNSSSELYYEELDYSPLLGTSYYRLKLVDLNGDVAYSQIESFNLNDVEIVCFYPNPASESSLIVLASPMEMSAVTYEIYDINGKIIYAQDIEVHEGYNYIRIDVSTLSHGMYLFVLSESGKSMCSKHFLIE